MVECSPEEFEELVADALDAIPDELGERMDNVVVVVEDEPTPEQLDGAETLLGLYEGVDLTERSPLDYTLVLPDRITIFRIPHLDLAEDADDLAEQVRVTVLHEVAHHFGIDDDRLEALGWD